MGLDATAPASPDTVTAEPFAAANAVSDTSVTVIVLLAPAAGLLWPMALVVKDSAVTAIALPANPSRESNLVVLRKLIRFFADQCSIKLSNA
jgi:hypothetical protein